MKTGNLRLIFPALLATLGLAWLPAISLASPITTIFASDNGGANGGAVYFDLLVGSNAITITGFDTNAEESGVFSGFGFYTIQGASAFGSEGDASAWTLQTTGILTSSGTDNASPVALASSVTLSADTLYGIALVMPGGVSHEYTDGTGSNQSYANADLSLTMGSADNTPFAGGFFAPRVWNGSIYYTVIEPEPKEVPGPGTLALFGLGLIGLGFARRSRGAA